MPAIRIRQHQFDLPRQWHEGHKLTAGEAQALTRLFAENIRNNVDKWVIGVLGDRQVLTSQEHQDLQARIGAYAEEYEFKVWPEPYRPETGLERHIRLLAEDQIRQELELGPDEQVPQGELSRRMLEPALRAKAEGALAIERRVAQEALEELL